MTVKTEVTSKNDIYEIKVIVICIYQNKFHLNPTVNNGDMTIRHIDDVILRQPEVPLSTTTVETFKWFGQEVTKLWMDKPNDKKE